MKGIRIPIHGFVELTPLEIALIDSQPMRRLRRIKQLAMCDEVYPGATHTRFEHSIGVMHIASRMFDSIFKESKGNEGFLRELGYDTSKKQYWKKAIRLAALLHDVGHPPFSHAGEGLLPEGKKHEDYTIAIIEKVLSDTFIIQSLNDNDPICKNNVDSEIVASFFKGSLDRRVLKDLFAFTSLISSQIDADRCDYLLRDSYHIGVNYGKYDLERVIKTITLGNDPKTDEPDFAIAFEEGGRHAIEGLLIARYMMFLQVYLHHTRHIYDYHLNGAIKYILNKKCGIEHYPICNERDDVIEYLQWDDHRVIALFNNYKNTNVDIGYILERNHHYMCWETNPTPGGESVSSDGQGRERDEFIRKLDEQEIEKIILYIDDQVWEKYGYHKKDQYKIHIIRKIDSASKTVIPINSISPIVSGLKTSTYNRIYVPRKSKAIVDTLIKGENDGDQAH